jgi:hypothetical protein
MLNQAKETAKLKAEPEMLRQDPAAEGGKNGEKAAEAGTTTTTTPKKPC